ncbi:MAG: alpha/beta hydrolase, partial [Sulfurovum sp.]|nr:alpha/beta hydrolase [Sulfurovum sp.]
ENTIKTFFPCEVPKNIYAKKVHMIVSDNDQWVKMIEAEGIAMQIGASLSVIQSAGHINADSGYGKWELIEKLVLKK